MSMTSAEIRRLKSTKFLERRRRETARMRVVRAKEREARIREQRRRQVVLDAGKRWRVKKKLILQTAHQPTCWV